LWAKDLSFCIFVKVPRSKASGSHGILPPLGAPEMADLFRDFLRFLLLYVIRPVGLLVGALVSSFYNVLFVWWIDPPRKPAMDGFPPGFRVQRIGVESAKAVSHLPASDIAAYFLKHPETAKALIDESCDKRYSPSTFITQEADGLFRVGWCSRKMGYECVRDFSNLADAATDYLLFSLGKGRWTRPKQT
jgi:hypothetical protein